MSVSWISHVGLGRAANKPHYIYRPSQALRRLRYYGRTWEVDQTRLAPLPWGVDLECWPGDKIGASVLRTGIYDLLATEAIFRLVDRGEIAVDAGANVGYMTSALARAAGPAGRVASFEPYPLVHTVLMRNAERWADSIGIGEITVHRIALSDHAGSGAMAVNDQFSVNRGTARVVTPNEDEASDNVPIVLARLDGLVTEPVGVLKLDVEGHELQAIEGATALIRRGAVRDVVFEEHDAYPTPVTDHLEQFGFEIFALRQRLIGPSIIHPASAVDANPWDPPVLIATIDRDRLRARFKSPGWVALRRSRTGERGRGRPLC